MTWDIPSLAATEIPLTKPPTSTGWQKKGCFLHSRMQQLPYVLLTGLAFLTGQYPARTGITDYLRPNSELYLDTNLVTLAKALKLNGYHTGMTGKWHLSGYASRRSQCRSPAR
jgi:hypothetical protein